MKTDRVEESFLNRSSLVISMAALFGIPAAGMIALVFAWQIPRLLYGQANPLLAAAEIGSLITVLVLLFLLRACLARSWAAAGFYRNVLDFLAMARWHASVKVALIGLLVLPPVWFFRSNPALIAMYWKMGRRALMSGDFRDDLDRITTSYQLALMGGVPLLFGLHLLSRWKPQSRVLPWLLVPVLFVGTAIAVVVIVTILH
jgi:hypothetical protein